MKKIIISGFEFLKMTSIPFHIDSQYDILYSDSKKSYRDDFLESLKIIQKNHLNIAKKNEYEYLFINKNFISKFKKEYENFNVNNLGVDGYADLAKFFWIKEMINSSYDEVIWIDCDLYFFENFTLPKIGEQDKYPIFGDARIIHEHNNNIITKEVSPGFIFAQKKDIDFIDWFLDFLKYKGRLSSIMKRCDYGNQPLTFLDQKIKFKTLKGTGIITPRFLIRLENDKYYFNAIDFIKVYDKIWRKYEGVTCINLSVFHNAYFFKKLINDLQYARNKINNFKKL